jgi:hypothetical protein
MPEHEFVTDSMKTTQNDTTIEQDFQELDDISNNIMELVKRRYIVTERIKSKHSRHRDRINQNDDWYEGDIQGRPVPDRNCDVAESDEVPYETNRKVSGRY